MCLNEYPNKAAAQKKHYITNAYFTLKCKMFLKCSPGLQNGKADTTNINCIVNTIDQAIQIIYGFILNGVLIRFLDVMLMKSLSI